MSRSIGYRDFDGNTEVKRELRDDNIHNFKLISFVFGWSIFLDEITKRKEKYHKISRDLLYQ